MSANEGEQPETSLRFSVRAKTENERTRNYKKVQSFKSFKIVFLIKEQLFKHYGNVTQQRCYKCVIQNQPKAMP